MAQQSCLSHTLSYQPFKFQKVQLQYKKYFMLQCLTKKKTTEHEV